MLDLAVALRRENPAGTAAQIRRIIAARHGWAPDERTLQRHFTRVGVGPRQLAEAKAGVFAPFEASRPNELWVGDALSRRRDKASNDDAVVMPTRCADGLAGWLRPAHRSALSEAVEEVDQSVGGLVAQPAGVGRGGARECGFLQGEIGMKVDLRRRDGLVAQPERDDGGVDAGA